MSRRERKAPSAKEQACVLCRRAGADPDVCGRKLRKQRLCAHEFCLFCADELYQEGEDEVGLMGFLPEDIQRTVKQAARKRCFVCGESGATITCSQTGCKRRFHLPCAVEGSCVTHWFGDYRSFCWEHRPQQAVKAAPGQNTACLICQDPVEDTLSYGTMVCPLCEHAWFHRGCIQKQALHAGLPCFCCPHCQNDYGFLSAMLAMGIRIPFSGPSWMEDDAYARVHERHSRCDARQCLCPGGREQADEEGPWQLLVCCSCAAEGTHRRCSCAAEGTHRRCTRLRNRVRRWECDSCAGLGSAPGASSKIARPSTASQPGSGPPHGSPAAQTSSPSSGSQLPSRPSRRSPALARGGRSRRTGYRQMGDRSHLRHRAPTPYPRRRRRREGSPGPAPSAERIPRNQAALGPSRISPPPEMRSPSSGSQLPSRRSRRSRALARAGRSSPAGPMRMGDRSGSRRRAPTPYPRPRRRR